MTWLCVVFAVAGCSSLQEGTARISGKILTIYGSEPLNGASSVRARSVLSGARLALAQAGEQVGNYRIEFRALDDSTPQRGGWDPGKTSQNARLAAGDPTTIGYLGELDSGASAIAIPLLNRAEIPQISSTNTAVGLTIADAGASPGEPDKYYPTGARTYVRVVPNDVVQAKVQVRLQRSLGCKSSYVLDDNEVDGADTATTFQIVAQAAGLVTASQSFDPTATDYSALAASVAESGANCVLISALPGSNAALLTKQIAAALPHAKVFATAELAQSTYVDPVRGGIPLSIDSRVVITSPALTPKDYPPAATALYVAYSRRYGAPEPDAIFGYESMSLLLRAISRATHHGTKPPRRSKVLAALFSTRGRRSVLGTYSIDQNGDTTLRDYGVYRVVAGHLQYWKRVSG